MAGGTMRAQAALKPGRAITECCKPKRAISAMSINAAVNGVAGSPLSTFVGNQSIPAVNPTK